MRRATPRICYVFFLYPCAVKGKKLVVRVKELIIADPDCVPYNLYDPSNIGGTPLANPKRARCGYFLLIPF